jgi:methylated-DNA-[protein]-cysteine S-methyltransferase
MENYWIELSTPVGPIVLYADDDAITWIDINGERAKPAGKSKPNAILKRAEKQMKEYFAGKRTQFDLPLAPSGTDFQMRVWKAMQKIPFGQVLTYGQLARVVNRPAASRAVGAACGRNPLPIVVPCHRVVGSTGSLTGFGGGLEMKQWLLEHEGIELKV